MDVLWNAIRNPILGAIGAVSVIVGVTGMIFPLVVGIPLLILGGICFRIITS
jgi:uncharacterized membrane protein YbaN (DUF454 family)